MSHNNKMFFKYKIFFSLLQFDSQYSYLKIIQTDDTRSLLRADTSVLILMPLYREIKNYKELIQWTVLANTNVADTVTPSRSYIPS